MKRSPSLTTLLAGPLAALVLAAAPQAGAQDTPTDPTAPGGLPEEVKIETEKPAPVDLPDVEENEEEAPPVVTDKVFDALPEEQKEKAANLLNEAARFVQGIRLQEALAKPLGSRTDRTGYLPDLQPPRCCLHENAGLRKS